MRTNNVTLQFFLNRSPGKKKQFRTNHINSLRIKIRVTDDGKLRLEPKNKIGVAQCYYLYQVTVLSLKVIGYQIADYTCGTATL